MRPINEQVILITGATDGMGRELAKDLASQGATLLLHGRDQARGEATLTEIRAATGNKKLAYYRADLSSLDEVRDLARRILAERHHLDVLVNNAGIGAGRRGHQVREFSRDGYELRFAVNYLAPFLLTRDLLPLLKASVPSRIVNVASVGQAPINFDNLMLGHGYSGDRAYSQSKLALIMLTFDLAEELQGTGVTANTLHPATYMDTKMVLESVGYNLSSVRDGVAATIRLVTDPEFEAVTGRYFDQLLESRAGDQAYDRGARARLRLISEQLTGLAPVGR
jgi:NAD(P)-dependent dehydrogenase (short-subunit alcohol dehydrogenase family)